MDGSTFRAGAVGAVRNIKNAIRLARAIMTDGRHVFLVGEGAERFAREHGLPHAATDELITTRQYQRWQAQQTTGEPRDGWRGCLGFIGQAGGGNLNRRRA